MSVPEVERWYKSAHWQKIRRAQLQREPFCRMCRERGEAVAAEVVDHIEPHRNDYRKFWFGETQSLCKRCHDNDKRYLETHGYSDAVGLDGWPADPRHPVYRAGGPA